MIQAYNDGIPANGKPVPDGAVMAKVEWAKQHNTAPPYPVTVPGPLIEVSFMVKDAKRFPGTTDGGTRRSGRTQRRVMKPFGDSPAFANTCHACHTIVKARDFVYTDFAQR